jgi:hypothetical protein
MDQQTRKQTSVNCQLECPKVIDTRRGGFGVFYELSDLLAFDLFTGNLGSSEEQHRRKLMKQTLDLLKKVVEAGASLIGEYCKSEGLVFDSVSGNKFGAA